MGYTEDFLKKLVQCGTLAYPISKIINVLEVVDARQFEKDFNDVSSDVYKNYKKGCDMSDFVIDSKLFEMAKGGDLKAITKYEIRKSQQTLIREKEKRNFNRDNQV